MIYTTVAANRYASASMSFPCHIAIKALTEQDTMVAGTRIPVKSAMIWRYVSVISKACLRTLRRPLYTPEDFVGTLWNEQRNPSGLHPFYHAYVRLHNTSVQRYLYEKKYFYCDRYSQSPLVRGITCIYNASANIRTKVQIRCPKDGYEPPCYS